MNAPVEPTAGRSKPAKAKADKVFEIKGRVLVFATIYLTGKSKKEAEAKARMGQFARVDFEDHSVRLEHLESVEEAS